MCFASWLQNSLNNFSLAERSSGTSDLCPHKEVDDFVPCTLEDDWSDIPYEEQEGKRNRGGMLGMLKQQCTTCPIELRMTIVLAHRGMVLL